MRLEWLPAAQEDRDAIYDFINAESRRGALRVDNAIEQQADRLVEYPYSGRMGRALDTRELIVVGTPCIVIYRVDTDRILVLRVIHTAQSWSDDSAYRSSIQD